MKDNEIKENKVPVTCHDCAFCENGYCTWLQLKTETLAPCEKFRFKKEQKDEGREL